MTWLLREIRESVRRGGRRLRCCEEVRWGFLRKAGLFLARP
jgi:hypothetical protein